MVPRANAPKKAMRELEGLTIHPVERVEQAIELLRSIDGDNRAP